jgi:hypothetical protein
MVDRQGDVGIARWRRALTEDRHGDAEKNRW